ncbi:acetyltransferase [Gallibacterium salpingitidis]|uniref:Acetyltransferase n=1 Tax=Gallibacterium salpingitidis TaxID=505341 RepID=A0AB36E0G3_9PAST|nr:acyltransferase [Gallibacterium salpingitidis]OBX08056.1 acetyltransferase [Gallibacterium salpingitidis]
MVFEFFIFLYAIILFPVCLWYINIILKYTKITFPQYPSTFNKLLEILRGIASYMVLMAHITMYFYSWNNNYAITIYDASSKVSSYLGQGGVVLFFMLTGYLFWNIVNSGLLDLNTFYYKRFYRLTPVMIVVVATVTLFDWIMGGMHIPTFTQLIDILKNFSFYWGGVHDTFYPDIIHRINNLWSLKWEWSFYLLLPLISVLCNSWITLTIFFILSVFVLANVHIYGIKNSDAGFFLAFYVGMSLVHLVKFMKSRKIDKNPLFIALLSSPYNLFVIIMIFLLPFFMMNESEIRPQNVYFVLLNAPLFLWFLFFSLNHSNKIDRENNKIARLRDFWFISSLDLGRVSYSLYLWHLFITFLVYKFFVSILMIQDFYTFIVLYPVVVILLSIPISILSYKFIELRFIVKKH